MFFRSLSLFAAVACAAFAVASPAGTPEGLSAVTGILQENGTPALGARQTAPGSDILGGFTDTFKTPDAGALSELTSTPKTRRDVEHHFTLPEAFKNCHDKAYPLIAELKAAVAVGTEINIDVIVGLLNGVIDVLGHLVIDVQFIIDNKAGLALTLDGVLLTVAEVAHLLAVLLYLIFSALAAVVVVVKGDALRIVLSLVANIGSIVAHILVNVFILVPDLKAALCAVLDDCVAILISLKLAVVLDVLGKVYHF